MVDRSNRLPQTFRAVVFDFDGTLIDSASDIAHAIDSVLKDWGRETLGTERVKGFIGDGSAMLVERAFAATGAALLPEAKSEAHLAFLEIYDAQPADPASIYPGVVETLEQLKGEGVKLGLCTNKPDRITRTVLDRLDLARLFDAVTGGDALPWRKPDGRHLSHVVNALGVGTEDSVMVGDNRNDVLAARNAGLPVVAVSYGYPRMPIAALEADIVIDRMSELPGALASLGRRST